MINSAAEISEQTELGYGQLLGVLWRRRFWFLGTFISVFVLATVMALRKPPIYQSSMQLLIESYYDDLTEGGVEVNRATQLYLMQSSEILQKVVERLKSDYPGITTHELKASLSLIEVENGEQGTNIVRVDYVSGDPIKAQKVLQKIKEVYQEYNLEQQQQRLSKGLSFTNKQVEVARENLLLAERELQQFRTKNYLITPLNKADSISSNLDSIARQREDLKIQYEEYQTQYNELSASLGRSSRESLLTISRLSQSSRYQELLNRIQEIEVELAIQNIKFTDVNPLIQNLLEQRQELQQLLEQERQGVLGGVSGQFKDEDPLQTEQQLSSVDLEMINELMQVHRQLSSLQVRDRSLAEAEQKLRVELNRFPNLISQYNILNQQVEVRRSALQQLLNSQQQLGMELNRGIFNWQVVEHPGVRPIGPNTQKDLLLGGVVGLFFGGLVSFGREAIDDVVHTSEQLKEGPLPLLGVTPKYEELSEKSGISLPWRQVSDTASILQVLLSPLLRESLDLIYKNIQLLYTSSQTEEEKSTFFQPKSLVVTSALPGEGKSTLVLGLALSAARMQQRILVIDANLRSPTLHEQLELPNKVGLSTFLSGGVGNPIPQSICLAGSNIDVLTSGSIPRDPFRLLSSQRMKKLMQIFTNSYDLVLVDTPAVLGAVDAIQIASEAEAVIMVARLDRVHQSELAEATALLSKLPLLGIVANGTREVKGSYLTLDEEAEENSHSLSYSGVSN